PVPTTGKSLNDARMSGQSFKYGPSACGFGVFVPRPSMAKTGPAPSPPPTVSLELMTMSGILSPFKSVTVGVAMMRSSLLAFDVLTRTGQPDTGEPSNL